MHVGISNAPGVTAESSPLIDWDELHSAIRERNPEIKPFAVHGDVTHWLGEFHSLLFMLSYGTNGQKDLREALVSVSGELFPARESGSAYRVPTQREIYIPRFINTGCDPRLARIPESFPAQTKEPHGVCFDWRLYPEAIPLASDFQDSRLDELEYWW